MTSNCEISKHCLKRISNLNLEYSSKCDGILDILNYSKHCLKRISNLNLEYSSKCIGILDTLNYSTSTSQTMLNESLFALTSPDAAVGEHLPDPAAQQHSSNVPRCGGPLREVQQHTVKLQVISHIFIINIVVIIITIIIIESYHHHYHQHYHQYYHHRYY